MCLRALRAAGGSSVTTTWKRLTTSSVARSRPARAAPFRTCSSMRGTASTGMKLRMTPSAISPASSSMGGMSAAT